MPTRFSPSEIGARLIQVSVDENTAANNTIVAAVSGHSIKVMAYVFTVELTTTLTFKSGSTAISGQLSIDDKAGAVVISPSYPILETVSGQALNITQGDAVLLGGHLTYFLERE